MSFILLFMFMGGWGADSTLVEASSSAVDSCRVDGVADDTCHVLPEWHPKTNHARAIAETAGFNLGLLAFNRYVQKAPFAYVTWKSIGRNFKPSSWYWDSDIYRTNLFFHPYHGALYHQAARSSGVAFYPSLAYSVGGSLMWELVGEMEHPSINDFVSTSVGGWAIGEVTHRVAQQIYARKSRGGKRVMNEVLAAVISPFGALNRLLDGDMLKPWRPSAVRYVPMDVRVGMMGRAYGKNGGETNKSGLIAVDLTYGSPTDEANRLPYDYFKVRLGIDPMAGQYKVNHLNIIAQVKNRTLRQREHSRWTVGVYQHFDYYATDDQQNKPFFKLSEAASVGIGLVGEQGKGKNRWQEAFYINAMILGGAASDYTDNRLNRDYSMGSGYSLKSHTHYRYGRNLRLDLLVHAHHLFSWHGYEDEDATKHYLEYSVMGDRGNAITLLVQPELSVRLYRRLHLSASGLFVYRHFRYAYRPRTTMRGNEMRVGLQWEL